MYKYLASQPRTIYIYILCIFFEIDIYIMYINCSYKLHINPTTQSSDGVASKDGLLMLSYIGYPSLISAF